MTPGQLSTTGEAGIAAWRIPDRPASKEQVAEQVAASRDAALRIIDQQLAPAAKAFEAARADGTDVLIIDTAGRLQNRADLMEELAKMAISLPLQGKREAWVKHVDRFWYFDQPEGPKVNMKRWGGGIPLLLSGPGAERLIVDNASEKQLEIFGLIEPRMKIDLTLENRKTIQIDVGDSTPDVQGFYVKLRQSKAIYTVHESWVHVLERLVLEPPYPDPDEKQKPVDL